MRKTMFLGMCLLAGRALADAPAGEQGALKPFVKNWSCDDTTKDEQGKDLKIKSEWKNKGGLRGNWVESSYEQKPQKGFPGFLGVGWFGWSAADKKYVFQGFDNGGGRLSLTAPEVAGGNSMSWTGELHASGQTIPARYAWNAKSDKEATFVLELQVGKDWMKVDDATCKGK
jgi:hypothetical protein